MDDKQVLFEKESICDTHEEEIEFICEDWLPFPKKTVSMIIARGGIGKSWVMLQLAMRHIEDTGEEAFLWLSEDPKGVSKKRASLLSKKFFKKDIAAFENLFIYGSERGTTDIVFNEKNFTSLKSAFKNCSLIGLDPLGSFFEGNENSNSDARKFMQKFIQWATEENKAIVFIHHVDKVAGKIRGAGAFRDAVRVVYEITEDTEDPLKLSFSLDKDNYAIKHVLKGSIPFSRIIFPSENKRKKGRN